jgi:hypothetical protein
MENSSPAVCCRGSNAGFLYVSAYKLKARELLGLDLREEVLGIEISKREYLYILEGNLLLVPLIKDT